MSKNIDLKLLQQLFSLGLSNKEAEVYIELLRGGEMSAIAASKATDLHRQFVYNALGSLKEKGLVQQIGEIRSKWRAENPRKLIAIAEEQESLAAKAAEALLALRPETAGQEVDLIEGTKAFRSRIIETMRRIPRNSTVRMITGEWERYFEQAGELVHAEWDRIRIAKGIHFRIIGPLSMREPMEEAAATRALTEYRTLSGLEKNLVNTVIYEDTVDFEIYGNPHVTFSIKNPDVALSQRNFFEALWENRAK